MNKALALDIVAEHVAAKALEFGIGMTMPRLHGIEDLSEDDYEAVADLAGEVPNPPSRELLERAIEFLTGGLG